VELRKYLWALRGVVYKFSFGRFGNLSYIGKPISILGRKNIFIDERVRIYPGARMEAANGGSIHIKNNTSIGQNFHITSDNEELTIGENTTISGNVFITNLDHDYTELNKHIMDQKRIVRKTKIGNNCFIGYGVAIQAGTVLGNHCVVGTNAVVRGIYPDYVVLAGVPAKIIKQYNEEERKWVRVEKK